MRRSTVIMMAALVVVSVAAVPTAGLAAVGDGIVADSHDGDTSTNSTDANTTDGTVDENVTTDNETEGNASVAPGERLSGIVGVQEAELEGEVDTRSFGLQIARAETNDSKASVVANQFGDIEKRIEQLEKRNASLAEARANGSISEGKYKAQVTELSTRMETAKKLANGTSNASAGIPTDLLESKGVNATAIQTLKDKASKLGGPAVAEIARSIAGPGAGPGGPPADKGPGAAPGDMGPGAAPGDKGPGGNMTDGMAGNATKGSTGNVTDGGMAGNATAGGDMAGNTTSGNMTAGNATAGGNMTNSTSGDAGSDGGSSDGSDTSDTSGDDTTAARSS